MDNLIQRVLDRHLVKRVAASAFKEVSDPNLSPNVQRGLPNGVREEGSQFPPARDSYGKLLKEPESNKTYLKSLIHKLMVLDDKARD
jgi:hypothetical protein